MPRDEILTKEETKIAMTNISLKIMHYNAFQLASVISSYPDDNYSENISELFDDDDEKNYCSSIDKENWNLFSGFLEETCRFPEKIDDICSDYIDLFDRGKTTLYETEYGRDRIMAKTNELADLAGFYKAFGLESESPEIIPEMQDHISVELEFYAYLLMKQIYLEEKNDQEGSEIVLDARKKFLENHLGRFVKAITIRLDDQNNPFFLGIFSWINSLVEKECKLLEVKPDIIEWLSKQSEPEEFDCATTAGCGLAKNSDKSEV